MSSRSRTASSPWLAVAGAAAVYVSFGTVIGSMASLVDEISTDLDLSRSTMGSILGAWALAYVFTAIPAGAAVDRLGVRRSLAVGALSMVASLLLRALATGPVGLFVGVAVFGVGGPLISVGAPKLVSTLFAAEARRLPTGLMTAAPALGSAIGLALTTPVLLPLTGNAWRGVLVIFAALAALTGVAWWLLTRQLPAAALAVSPTNRHTFTALLRLGFFRVILLVGLLHFLFSHALGAWLPEILTDNGLSDAAAGYVAALSTAVGIAGSVLLPRIVPRNARLPSLAAIFAVMAVTVALLATATGAAGIVAVSVMGLVRAGVIPLLFLLIMDHPQISTRYMGAATGLFFAIGEIGGYFGPWLVGLIADRFDGFSTAVFVLAAVAGLGVAINLIAATVRPAGYSVAKT